MQERNNSARVKLLLRIRDMLFALDKDNSGSLSKQELESALSRIGRSIDESQLESALGRIGFTLSQERLDG